MNYSIRARSKGRRKSLNRSKSARRSKGMRRSKSTRRSKSMRRRKSLGRSRKLRKKKYTRKGGFLGFRNRKRKTNNNETPLVKLPSSKFPSESSSKSSSKLTDKKYYYKIAEDHPNYYPISEYQIGTDIQDGYYCYNTENICSNNDKKNWIKIEKPL